MDNAELERILDFAAELIENSPDECEDLPEMAETVAWARTACRRALETVQSLEPTHVWVLLMTAARLDKDFTVASVAWDLADDGTAEAGCPSCYRSLEIASDGQVAFPIATEASAETQVSTVADPYRTVAVGELPGWSARLEPFVALAWRAGHPKIANVLTSLYGTAQCPFCTVWFHLGKALCIREQKLSGAR
jgi:hypothetical protein